MKKSQHDYCQLERVKVIDLYPFDLSCNRFSRVKVSLDSLLLFKAIPKVRVKVNQFLTVEFKLAMLQSQKNSTNEVKTDIWRF